ncbi:WAT1-related protein At5g40240 isoform X2 [Vigna angularis]|uniref:WAT1-related protein At5g40240 isoform X2 n=1 Tax=Phaseolus angularis TaxID=3914 RepID=UPI0022B586BC|nr:WAT1-related protein At5g40240 isoform X2 [Vigna angularis]
MGKLTLPFVGMIMAEFAQVGLIILSKKAMAQGMTNFIFIFYSNTIAALLLLPISLLIHRFERPPITFSILCEFFLLALLGLLGMLGFTTAQLHSAHPCSTSFLVLHSYLLFFLGLFLAADCIMASAYIILQASILKKYPAELIVVFFYCFFVAIQSAVTCLVVERDISAWSLEPKLRLLAVLYSGVMGSAFQVGIISWCLHKTGPVFVSMFKPLGILISVVLGVFFLGDAFYLGSLVGAIVIVVGFYSVLWGKAEDIKDGGVRMIRYQKVGDELLLEENGHEDTQGP